MDAGYLHGRKQIDRGAQLIKKMALSVHYEYKGINQ